MPESADPLGKRALFWAPAQREEDDPRRPAQAQDRGKHALFSAPDSLAGVADLRGEAPRYTDRTGRLRVSGSRRPSEVGSRPARFAPGPLAGRFIGPVTLECSSCRARSDVDVFEYLLLHLPVWLWRPGKGYTRLMTCPACRRRTWISASLSAWSR
jgi:hypothetical protein